MMDRDRDSGVSDTTAPADAASAETAMGQGDAARAALKKAVALHKAGRLPEAATAYRDALTLAPCDPRILDRLGICLATQGKRREAIGCFEQSLAVAPDNAAVRKQLGKLQVDSGDLQAAVTTYKTALTQTPDDPELLAELGIVHTHIGRHKDAIGYLRRALDQKPDDSACLNNLAIALDKRGHVTEAIQACEKAIALRPDFAAAYSNLGSFLKDSGQIDAAMDKFAKAAECAPVHKQVQSNLVYAMNYSSHYAAADIWAQSQRWAERFGDVTPPPLDPTPTPEPDRRLRIGYVSPDFRRHSVAYLFEPVLAAHDRTQFEIVCYAELNRADETSRRLESLADDWRPTLGRNDAEVAAQVRQDRIDILVDLAGHTAQNRLLIFAHKPAPVQVTWLGYPGTTGLRQIDYRLSDAIADPPGPADEQHSERLVRLPNGFFCYGPQPDAPGLAALPALETGQVTFGSFNNLAKVTPAVIETWAAVLAAVPRSRLMLKSMAFVDPATQDRFRTAFARHGIDPARLDLVKFIHASQGHLAAYGQVDVALDSFPYNGTVTTCEALWMGVPVVTLCTDRHAGRVGASILSRIGLDRFVAKTIDDYVAIAAAAANDLGALAALRRRLRADMAASPLCDSAGLTRDLEAAYRDMWRAWCDARP